MWLKYQHHHPYIIVEFFSPNHGILTIGAKKMSVEH